MQICLSDIVWRYSSDYNTIYQMKPILKDGLWNKKTQIIWVVVPRRLVNSYRRFEKRNTFTFRVNGIEMLITVYQLAL